MACTLSYSLTGLTGDCQNLNQGAFDFMKYPSKFGDNLVYPRISL